MQQGVQRRADGVAHIEVFDFFAQIDGAQPHREQGATEVLDDLAQAFLGREFTQARVFAQAATRAAPGDARFAQAGHDAVQVPVGGRKVGGPVHWDCPWRLRGSPGWEWVSNMEVPR
ncbi:hypothetical protein D3C87_1419460 [compost metagenome]